MLQVFDLWQDQLDIELGVALKAGLHLTCAQYEGLRYCLSHEYIEALNVHQRRVLDGTGLLIPNSILATYECVDYFIPTLPTMDAVRNWVKDEMGRRGLEWDSEAAQLSPDIAMESLIDNLPSSVVNGLYHFQLIADGVNVYRSASVCNVGLKLFDPSPGFNSLTSMTLLSVINSLCNLFIVPTFFRAVLEGKDSYDNMKSYMEQLSKFLVLRETSTKKRYKLWGGGKMCTLNATHNRHVGDMVFISNLLGLGGHFGRAGENCVYCEVHSTRLFDRNASTKRTLSRLVLYQMAHLLRPGDSLPFQCPGCNKVFNNSSDLDADVEPQCRLEYERAHASSSWHRAPLVDIEPADYVLCCLHLLLSLSKLIFKKRILPMLFSDGQAKALNDFLHKIGICVPKQGKVGDSLATEQSHRVRFTGADCIALLKFWDEMVEVCLAGGMHVKGNVEWARDT